MARSALRATLCLAAVVVGAGSKAEMTTYNMIRPDRGYKNKGGDQNYKGLPRLIFNKLKLDFGKGYLMRDKDTGFGCKVRIPLYEKLLQPENIIEAGWAVKHKINYIPWQDWQRHPDDQHFVRTSFQHNFKAKLTSIHTRWTFYGANVQLSANSDGDFSWSQVGFNYGWRRKDKVGKDGQIIDMNGKDHNFQAEGRVIAGIVMPRIDKGRFIANRQQLWGRNTTIEGRWRGWGMEAIVSQPCKPIMPSLMFKTKHEVARLRWVNSRCALYPKETFKNGKNMNGVSAYGLVEYEDGIVDNGWGGTWVARYEQPFTAYDPDGKHRGYHPTLTIKRRWKFNDGFMTNMGNQAISANPAVQGRPPKEVKMWSDSRNNMPGSTSDVPGSHRLRGDADQLILERPRGPQGTVQGTWRKVRLRDGRKAWRKGVNRNYGYLSTNEKGYLTPRPDGPYAAVDY